MTRWKSWSREASGQSMFPPVLRVACADILIVTAVSYDPGSANASPSSSQHHAAGPSQSSSNWPNSPIPPPWCSPVTLYGKIDMYQENWKSLYNIYLLQLIEKGHLTIGWKSLEQHLNIFRHFCKRKDIIVASIDWLWCSSIITANIINVFT